MTPDALQTLSAISARWRIPLTSKVPVEIPGVTRYDLARLFASLGFLRGAEIGVMRGEYSLQLCGENPALRLFCVDPYSVRSDYNNGVMTQADQDDAYQMACARLSIHPGAVIMRAKSLDAVREIDDGSLDFVYIDGHHNFQNVTNDICEWTKKVRIGGIIAGDDYYKTARPVHGLHVQHVVDAFTDAYAIRPWFVLGRKVTQSREEARDRHRSFFWIRDTSPLDDGH